jgi:thioredoxin-dependent peroxiredoxin
MEDSSMYIQSGTPAPTFHALDLFGNSVDLAAYQGKPLLLSFFRNAACALCNLRVHALIERYADYHRAGLEIVAIFESPAESMRDYVGKQDAPFPLIADPAAHLYTLYGVESSEAQIATTMAMPATQAVIASAAAQAFQLTEEPGSNFLRMPADFFIGSDGRVLDAHYATYVWDHMPFERIEELLDVAVPG